MKNEIPRWWMMVSNDLKKAVEAAQKSFITPGVVIGFTGDEKKTSYLIRLNDGAVGEYPRHILGKKDIPTGVKIRSNLPEPKNVVFEPNQELFTFEVLREQIKLLPRLWLNRNIHALVNGEKMKEPVSFQSWVLLSPNKRKDHHLLKLLEMAVEYEGLKGLARFNDHATK